MRIVAFVTTDGQETVVLDQVQPLPDGNISLSTIQYDTAWPERCAPADMSFE